MKQPELGRTISELRKQKGVTQEELVAQCNISVRTIQRIEAGEVTPRSFTLKTILDALGEDLQLLQKDPSEDELFAHIPTKQLWHTAGYMKIAWICGIVYFLSGFIEFAVDYARYFEQELILTNAAYISMKFIILVSYIYFMIGFSKSAALFKNNILQIGVFLLIAINIFFYGYDMISLYTTGFYIEYVLMAQSVFYGIGGMIFGYALLQLEKPLGMTATLAGGFKIGSSVMFGTVFLGWLGYVFLIPALFFQIILLYKIAMLVSSHKTAAISVESAA